MNCQLPHTYRLTIKTICIVILDIFAVSCNNNLDKKNFDLVDYVNSEDKIFQQLDKWGADSAFIQFIGFPPSTEVEHYTDLGMKKTFEGFFSTGTVGSTFSRYDMNHPIIIVYALRRNNYQYSGNMYNEMGYSRTDIGETYDILNYTNVVDTYEFTPFYLASFDGNPVMLTFSQGHEHAMDFFDEIIELNPSFALEKSKASKAVGIYVKGVQEIKPVEAGLLHRIQESVGFTNTDLAKAPEPAVNNPQTTPTTSVQSDTSTGTTSTPNPTQVPASSIRSEEYETNTSVVGQYPQGSSRILTPVELQVLDPSELRIMRNEIFARHGYIFKDAQLRAHFTAQPWYDPRLANVDHLLSPTERQNIVLIKKYE